MATQIEDVQTGPTAHMTPEDYILRLHNDGLGQEEIAKRYAERYFGHDHPIEGDVRFVDFVLTNREG
ncbi:MAG: hypothetical protein QM811_23145 [Pirellulales bacterium]